MANLYQQLHEKFKITLQKYFHFTRKEISALWAICVTIIGSSSFSFSAVSRNFGQKVGRNFLSKVLKKYYKSQNKLLKIYLDKICSKLESNQKIFIIINDTLVKNEENEFLRLSGCLTIAVIVKFKLSAL
ncbi:MAG: hypothetical protein HeimC3_36970 [Candidatus Heimdallarchaeota archaeon LC_3]|nr:MAG: hypothetical protein HeimC3_36970 [Candidatus Heimdallarchaeota archaeon LC_3]